MKFAIMILLCIFISACSKPGDKKTQVQSAQDKTLETLFYNQTVLIQDSGYVSDFTDLNLGNIIKNLPIKISIILENKKTTSESLTISWDGANLNFKNNCPEILEFRRRCSIDISVDGNALAVGTEIVGLLNVNNENYSISGQVVAPSLSEDIIVSDIDFNNVEARREKHIKTIISNKGDSVPLIISQSQLSSDFSIVQNNCPAILLSRKSCSLEIKAMSSSEGIKLSKLVINNKDLKISANFVAYNPILEIIPTPSSIDLGSISYGSGNINFSIKYFNRSFLDLNNPEFDLPTGISVASSTCVNAMRFRRSCEVKFSVNPNLLESSFNGQIKMKESDVKESLPFSILANLSNPSLSVTMPPYTSGSNVAAVIVTDFADEIKVSNLNDCSDGSYSPLLSPLNIILDNLNASNTKYFKAKKFNNESDCISATSIHDNINPSLSFSNLETMELNRTGLSSNYTYEFNSVDANNSVSYSYEVYSSKDCSSSLVNNGSNSFLGNLGSILTSLPVREYRSVLVSTTDLAGNSNSLCSPYITFGQPSIFSVPLFSSVSKIYENPTNFTGNVKDIFNNNLVNAPILLDSLVDSKTITTDGSGNFSFKVSSDNNYNESNGVRINYIDGTSEKIFIRSLSDPMQKTSGSVAVRRRSCQELSLYDNLSVSGDRVVDPDLESSTISEYSLYCDVTTGKDLESVAHSQIIGREKVSRSLKSIFGVERIMISNLVPATGESVSSGAAVSKINSFEPRIRFVGSWLLKNVGTGSISGTYIDPSVSTDYVEVVFYGTGLNMLNPQTGVNYDYRVSIDGGTESTNLFLKTSDILAGRRYNSNIIRPVINGLSLGWHTAKIRNVLSNGLLIQGFEILNERANILTYNGGAVVAGQLDGISTPIESTLNQYISGTRGARVVKYVQNNSLDTVVQEVDTVSRFLQNADHSNEEIVKSLNFRNFGTSRSDDFATLSSESDRAFTLDDGSTTLVGDNVRIFSSLGEDMVYSITNNTTFLTLTFIGTGLDIRFSNNATINVNAAANAFEVFVDGVSVGNLPVNCAETHKIVTKIASGLPYGSHTVSIRRNVPDSFSYGVTDFYIYQPKKPIVPSNSVEVADYNVLANYAQSSAGALNVSTGTIRKSVVREMLYSDGPSTGTIWAMGAVNPAKINGAEVSVQRHNSLLRYTFFGTGIEIRGDGIVGASSGVDLYLIKSNDETQYSARSTNFPTATFSTFGGWSFNQSTGRLNQGVSAVVGSGWRVSGLPLGFYTIQAVIDHTGGSNMGVARFSSVDVITPIHSNKGSVIP